MTTWRYIPVLMIVSPRDKTYYKPDASIECFGGAYERIPGTEGPGKDLSDKINWKIVGPDWQEKLGIGQEFTFDPWMCGDYYVFADVIDTMGNAGQQMVKITVGLGKKYNEYDNTIIAATKGKDILPEVEKGKIHQESLFNPFAISKSGAMGISQFMKGTAERQGLKVPMPPLHSGTPDNPKELYKKREEFYKWLKTDEGKAWIESDEVDGSIWDPVSAIFAGVDYLQDQYDIDKFEDVPDTKDNRDRQRYALASYNAGPGYIKRAKKMIEEDHKKKKLLDKSSTDWDSIVWIGQNKEVKVKNPYTGKESKWIAGQTITYVDHIIGRNGGLAGYSLEYDP
ncbi:MAG: transglycosylase SLT domain-containing protein [bacterium]